MLVKRSRFTLSTALFLLALSTHPFGRAQDQAQSPNKELIYGTVFAQDAVLVLFPFVSGVRSIAQETQAPQPVTIAPNLMRLEGVDTVTGIHYVRLLLSLPAPEGSTKPPPRFTMECTDNKGKRSLAWFVSFGGVADVSFTRPFRPTPREHSPPRNPSTNLKMTFEGYMKWKPYTRSWEILPSGELRYRNPGLHSPNLDDPRFFLKYLSSLPGLRIGYAKPAPESPPELLFQTRPLLDELNKSPVCQP